MKCAMMNVSSVGNSSVIKMHDTSANWVLDWPSTEDLILHPEGDPKEGKFRAKRNMFGGFCEFFEHSTPHLVFL